MLCEIAHTQPQAAYISFTKAFKSKFTYFQRTIPSFEQYLEPLQDVINRTFVPAIIGQDTPLSDQLMACFSLPTSRGGLNIPDLQEETPYQHSSSKLITNVHTESILRQEECMLPCSSSIQAKNFNSWLPLGLGVWLKGTRAAAISVVGLSFLGLLDFGLSSTIGC